MSENTTGSITPEKFFTYTYKEVYEEDSSLSPFLQDFFIDNEYFFEENSVPDVSSMMHIRRVLSIANAVIDDEGKFDDDQLQKIIADFSNMEFSLGPNRHLETLHQSHIVKVLKAVRDSAVIKKMISRFYKPHNNIAAEQIVRDTLDMQKNEKIKDVHVKRAVLSALLTFLRQNVGSCFATAPCIIIQNYQQEQFLKDISDLLNTGRLSRIFQGIQYTAPLSHSWGFGAMKSSINLSEENYFSIIESLKATNVVEKTNIEKMVRKMISSIKESGTFMTTPENIIKMIILEKCKMTTTELEKHENTLKAQTSSMNHFIVVGQHKKNDDTVKKKYDTFLENYAMAERTFRSLTDNALLKSWEFSVASFAETKADFCKWNLYASLGFDPKEQGGIGKCIYDFVNEKIDHYNAKVKSLEASCEPLNSQHQYIVGRINRASTDQELNFLKAEYYSINGELESIIKERNKAHQLACGYADLFTYLIKMYHKKFSEYFQEVYDPSVQEVAIGPYDDSPAGFRLVYKNGRENSALWTYITSAGAYIDSLIKFFLATETEISSLEEMQDISSEFSSLVSSIILHVKTEDFLASSIKRMATIHDEYPIRDPLNNLHLIKKKPWAYSSGGRMDSLVSCYYVQKQLPTIVSREIENTVDLLSFLLETMKDIPQKISKKYVENPDLPMLMTSPTHAFNFKPGKHPFIKGWNDNKNKNTYTWIRDEIIIAQRHFFHMITITPQEQRLMINTFFNKIPSNMRKEFKYLRGYSCGINSFDFRSIIVDNINRTFPKNKNILEYLSDIIDTILYSSIPLTATKDLIDNVGKILIKIPQISKNETLLILDNAKKFSEKYTTPSITSSQFLQILKALIMQTKKSHRSFIDYHHEIIKAMRAIKIAIPEPLIFADSNWVKFFFAFIVNPGNGKLEMWRMDYSGCNAFPMSQWNEYFNKDTKFSWELYTNPTEYNLY